MDNTIYGLKEIYECVLKATYDMKMGSRLITAGEPIVIFDSLQFANFSEIKNFASAKGGYGNQSWVTWESTKELPLTFSQGVFSQTQLALLGNSAITEKPEVLVPKQELLELDENLQMQLRYKPEGKVFVYNRGNGKKYEQITIEDNVIKVADGNAYDDISVYYDFLYEGASVINIGRQAIPGYLEFTGKTRLKDDVTGKLVTGILHMPKVKLMSDFSIRLGNNVPPAVGNFKIVGYPTGSKGSEKVMEFISLNDDIDSDI